VELAGELAATLPKLASRLGLPPDRPTGGQLVDGSVFIWAGGVKAPDLVARSELPTGHNGRVKVDQYLRVLDHPDIYVAGDLASVTDPGHRACPAPAGPDRPGRRRDRGPQPRRRANRPRA
ncbi:MAG: FAD-dependent oxidoreductase, partial [Streptosporangiaceae bacterium]